MKRGCTTRRRNTHIAVTGIVHYPWHPWRNRSVFIDDVIDRNGRVYFRCHVEETLHHRALEIPDWMLQETCSTTGLVETPVVNCSALRNLKALLDGASSHDLGLTEAQCFEGGADATDTGSKAVSMPTVSATNRDTDVCNDRRGSRLLGGRNSDTIRIRTYGGPGLHGPYRRPSRARGFSIRTQKPRVAATGRSMPTRRYVID